ncbi:Heterokaryon incompatibility, partial [Macrophomina phaseolina MS6]
ARKSDTFETEKEQEEKRRQFLQHADDEWIHTVDNDFPRAFFKRLPNSDDLPLYAYSSTLCKSCTTIDLSKKITMAKLRKKLKPCMICRMQPRRSRAITERIQLLKAPALRVCASPRIKMAHRDIQIGFPVLPEPDSPIRFRLFREWLKLCDRHHPNTGCHRGYDTYTEDFELPTRVIDVSHEKSDLLRLHTFSAVHTANDNAEDNSGVITHDSDTTAYIALSHCWGNLPEKEKRQFCLSRENINERLTRGFPLAILPDTFRDAVTVTRNLGKRYLWIDSVCIIQYGDNLDDWKKEVSRMEAVFRNAYCTIAATSAVDSNAGFLHTHQAAERRDPFPPYIKIHSTSHGSLYISSKADTFHTDVSNGLLNQRAWVLQERALSRRTIHFTSNQAYFECGDGVRCETLTYMRNSAALFLGDPAFPASLNLRPSRGRIGLFQSLFTTYSKLGITKATDRSLAIYGLERRLTDTFKTRCSYGVFEKYLGRSLLWQRAEDSKELKRIAYPDDRSVPSWSWMAYDGNIEYVEVDSDVVEWDEGILFEDNMLRAQVRRFRSDSCKVERGTNGSYFIGDREGNGEQGWLRYDRRRRIRLRKHRCVIGREESESRGWLGRSNGILDYYVLVVAPVDLDGHRAIKRVGVGCIPSRCIIFRSGRSDESIL